VLTEDPTAMLYLGEDNKLYAFSGSKPADYTIKYLRLNREQLIKLRHIRRFMDSWQKDLTEKKMHAEEKLQKIKDEQRSFLDQNITASTQKEQKCLDAMKMMYEMLVLTAEQSLLQIKQEIERLNKLVSFRTGSDSLIDE
jgi:DNA-binding transcriptional MerR regulator